MFGGKDIEIIDFSFSKHWNSGLRLFFSKHWNYRFQLFQKLEFRILAFTNMGIRDFGFYKHGNSGFWLFQTLELSISAFPNMENLKIWKSKLLTFNAWKSKTFEFHCLEV